VAAQTSPIRPIDLLVQHLTKRFIHRVGNYLRPFFVRVNAVALIERFHSGYAFKKKRDQMNLILAREQWEYFVDRFAIFRA